MAVAEPSNRVASAVGAVVWLDDQDAAEVSVVGAKAHNLAVSASLHLPVLPGFAITVAATHRWDDDALHGDVRDAWSQLSDGGRRPLVVRSSSVVEDAEGSSMAGRFTSVLDVRGWERFVDAVAEVIASAAEVGDEPAPMGVLVQPLLEPDRAGVAFGTNPVDGTDELLVAVVDGGPDTLVAGVDAGETIRLSRHGRIHPDADVDPSDTLSRRERHELAHLIRRLDRYFGGPQDIEWAIDRHGRLWLLQTRPVTTEVPPTVGPRLGPGPVAETFPTALSTLEEDLWVPGLRDGITEAVALSGAQRRKQIKRSPVVVSIQGRLAVDLELFGIEDPGRRWWTALDPRIGGQRLAAAWRVGRLRAAIVALSTHLIETTDAQLSAIPGFAEMSDEDLLSILANTRRSLTALHGHEVLTGMLMPDSAESTSAAGLALSVLAQARRRGLSDDEIIRTEPIVLGLLPPRIGPAEPLPDLGTKERRDHSGGAHDDDAAVDPIAVTREALRLRARWVQELSGRAAWELGERLVERGTLARTDEIRMLHLDELVVAIRRGRLPEDLHDRVEPGETSLPAVFRLTEEGEIVAVRSTTGRAQGAGGGQGRGPVHLGDDPQDGAVLVVRTLDPALASVLGRLNGLVAETGSPLSHLAILAREMGVATVVGQPDATTTYHEGELVAVDGVGGVVERIDAGRVAPSVPHEIDLRAVEATPTEQRTPDPRPEPDRSPPRQKGNERADEETERLEIEP